jgi:hypothetical protein
MAPQWASREGPKECGCGSVNASGLFLSPASTVTRATGVSVLFLPHHVIDGDLLAMLDRGD